MVRAKRPQSADEVVNFMTEYSRAYISGGGPTSRLEDGLVALGAAFGYASEVFATPTGIFVSVVDPSGNPHTALCRVKESSMNLSRLCWLEGILEDLHESKIGIEHAMRILHSHHIQKSTYSILQSTTAAFTAGFALSFPAYGRLVPALASGLIAAIVWWFTGPALKGRITSSIFRDFIGCILTLFIAAAFQIFHPAPFDAYTIGGIVMLVPGLALTSAISELADQNLLSGTAKLMHAFLTLLGLGLAYLLFDDLSQTMGLGAALAEVKRGAAVSTMSRVYFLIVSILCFGVIFKVPRRSLLWATLTGFLGWIILRLTDSATTSAAGPFLASLSVGIVSLALSKLYKVPSQVFSVPGITAMLPGMLALTSIQSFAMGHQNNGLDIGFRVALTAGCIAFGLFTARIPFALKKSSLDKSPRAA